jgi:hypothetical protein
MGLLLPRAAKSIEERYFKPRGGTSPEGGLVDREHYIRILGDATCSSSGVQAVLRVDLIERNGGHWKSAEVGVPFERLGSYEEVPETMLPWKNYGL